MSHAPGWARTRSLRGKLLGWLLPPMMTVLVISLLVSYDVALRFANDAYDAGLFDSATALADQVRFEGGLALVDLTPQAKRILVSDPVDRAFYRVIGPSGSSLAGDERLSPPVARYPGPRQPVYYDASISGEVVRAAAIVVEQPDTAARATVIVAETVRKRAAIQRRLIATVLLPQLALIVAAAAIIWFGIVRGLRSLSALADAVARRGWSDLRPVDEGRGPAEVRPLIEAINGLMRRLAGALGAQQRFIADAAHQLRTPLAGLMAHTELALAERDAQAHKASLEQLQASARRSVRLVNQLLTLARAEPGNEPGARFTSVDLLRLAKEVTMQWVPDAIARNVDLGYAGNGEPVVVEGDELLLGEMLGNLIDNALRHGASPGTVTVTLASSPQPELSVQDDGPGIPDTEAGRVFERFHRLPGSAQGGSGLGLAIVREIAHAHNATVAVRRASPAGGALFVVRFSAGSSRAGS